MKKALILLVVVALVAPGSVCGQDDKKTPDDKAPEKTPGETKKPADLEARVAALEAKIDKLTRSIEALTAKTGGEGTPLEKLPKAKSDASGSRTAMRPVINGGDGSAGRLMITNNSGCDQYLYINCRLWRVVQGKSYANVPRGNVIVQRPGGFAQTLSDWKTETDGTHVVRYAYP